MNINNETSVSYEYICYCDGGSRGNPGIAGIGVVIYNTQTKKKIEIAKYLGNDKTNNFAEYTAMVICLEKLVEFKAKSALVIADSELIVKQMNGEYSVKSPNIKPLYKKARDFADQIETIKIKHTYRSGNSRADELANEAMDKKQ